MHNCEDNIIVFHDIAGACPDQAWLFKKTFGGSVVITAANIRKALKAGINVNWAVQNLYVFIPIRADYEKAHARIRADYEKAHARVWAKYEKANAPIWAEYEKARARILIAILPKLKASGGGK